MTYAFILGRNPPLSIAEILSVFNRENIKTAVIDSSIEIFLVETDRAFDIRSMQDRLGGTIKIGEIYQELDFYKSETELYNSLSNENLIKNFFTENKGKIHFGLSLYFLYKNDELLKNYQKILKNLGIFIKKELKKTGRSGGFVQIKERMLSSVSVAKNELLTKGAEILLIAGKDRLYLGKTLSVQQFSSYSLRDYGRPERDRQSGMLPPKVAQILLNLSETDNNGTVLDPFCGSGTVISEAVLMGYKNILCGDISAQAVSSTGKNLSWLKNQYPQKFTGTKIMTFTADVTKLSGFVKTSSVDAIVTEPYLGPSLFKSPSEREIDATIRTLTNLYLGAFREFAKILKKGRRVVFIFPAFKQNVGFKLIDILPQLSLLGFTKNDFPLSVLKPEYASFLSDRQTVIYGRGDEFVSREIVVLYFS